MTNNLKTIGISLIATAMILSSCGSQKPAMEIVFSDANLYNDATVENIDGTQVLSLGESDGFYDLTAEAGALISTLEDYTISVKYKLSSSNDLRGYGHFLFAFSQLAENSAEEGPYLAFRLNEQRYEISNGGYQHEQIIMSGTPAPKDVWVHVLYRQSGRTGELYFNGELIGTNDNMMIPAQVFETAPEFCWIGKAPFRGDKYLSSVQVKEFKIFNRYLTDKEVAEL